MSKINIKMTVNGQSVETTTEPRTLLIHVLREELNLTGPHIGCDTSHCGACTVDIDGKSVKSCTVFAAQVEGTEVTTVEGIANPDGTLHALQEAFRQNHGAMRLLYAGHDHLRLAAAAGEPQPDRRRNPLRHQRQSVPLHRLPEHRQGNSGRGRRAFREGGSRMNVTANTKERVEKLQGLGSSRKRVEDARFTQGKGNYVDDIKLPGMLFGDFVRSPYGHARIKSINKDAALAAPGMVAVLTTEDLKPLNLHYMPTLAGDVQAVLADEKVPFQNQEVAFVVASDRYAAADAVDLVEIDYEELPALTDAFKAMDANAPLLREDIQDKVEGAHGPRASTTITSSIGRRVTRPRQPKRSPVPR